MTYRCFSESRVVLLGAAQDVWCHVQVQAPLKASSTLLITLTITNVKTHLSIASVAVLITVSGVYIAIYTGSYSLTYVRTHLGKSV